MTRRWAPLYVQLFTGRQRHSHTHSHTQPRTRAYVQAHSSVPSPPAHSVDVSCFAVYQQRRAMQRDKIMYNNNNNGDGDDICIYSFDQTYVDRQHDGPTRKLIVPHQKIQQKNI